MAKVVSPFNERMHSLGKSLSKLDTVLKEDNRAYHCLQFGLQRVFLGQVILKSKLNLATHFIQILKDNKH